jgi:hypothetical protein
MSPLVYLQIRRIKNGIRRSFKTPVRAAMTVLMAGYFAFMLFAFFGARNNTAHVQTDLAALDPRIPEALLTFGHLILFLYITPSPKYIYTIFSEADVANLFGVPFDRWRLFRFFLFTRSLLSASVFFVLTSFYASWTLRIIVPGLFPKDHVFGPLSLVGHAAFLLLALAGLVFWRLVVDIRRDFDRIPKTAFRNSVIAFLGLIVIAVTYHTAAAYSAGFNPLVGLAVAIDSIPLSIVLAPFRFLAQLFLHRFELLSLAFWTCAAFWIGVTVTGYRVLRSHHMLLYEYGMRIAEFRTQMVARFRDPSVQLKEKIVKKKEALRLPWFLSLMNFRRAGAIFWRDMIIAWRSYSAVVMGLHNVLLFAVVVGGLALKWYHVPVKASAVVGVSIITIVIGVFPLLMISVVSFAEILRRADVQKPLPLNALKTIAMHILQWTAMICSIPLLPFVSGMLLFPAHSPVILFIFLVACSFTHTVISGYFIVALFNPDQQDPIQRMYASLFGLFMAIAVSFPGGVALGIGMALHAPRIAVLVLVLVLNLTSSAVVHYLASRKYVSFVFTE